LKSKKLFIATKHEEENIMKTLKVSMIIGLVLVWSTVVFAAELKFTDGTLIRGEFQGERVRIRTEFGDLTPKVSDLAFVSQGKIELRDGSQVFGELLPGTSSTSEEQGTETTSAEEKKGLPLKTKYGTFELLFSMEDIEYIDFME
jgi:hypothetical protein